MTIAAYEVLEELLRTEWHVLHRGRCREDGRPVLLKTPCATPSRALGADLLEREYETLRELSVRGIPRAYELVREGGHRCLVLEDGGGMPLRTLLASGRPDLGIFFTLGIQLCAILAELHRRDIIHRNINPRNILVHPAANEVWLVDLSLASRTRSETSPIPRNLPGSTLPYASPEQTGRMNRVTDYRTDFYSLGVTFYELLTGVPPFESDDPLELIHWHIARIPASPAEVDPGIPLPLSRIVMKLLSKTAEERYQSALGLREDLAVCAREWAGRGAVADFPLGQRDVSGRFLISQKLYGRDREVEELLRAFDRSCEGATVLTLVSGYAGIGKTALIQELYKPLVRQRGYFITGKFDQIVRIPYGALIQAFRSLVQQLLTEGDDRLAAWRARLSEALGTGGGVLAQVIPEIELILGPQPPPPALGPTEAQNRFRLVFQNFLHALARKEHPLVVFLDDLQWADSATLSLLPPLLTSPDLGYLLLIGAYRDNEVDVAHPLAQALAGLEADGVRLHRVSLGPLALEDLTLFVRDTLQGAPSDVEPLARLVSQKTGGNPFFVIQFLKALRDAELLTFDYNQARWTFGMEAIAGAGMTDNVIDLMTRKIQRLAPRAQTALTLGACIGNQFDLPTLGIVSQQSDDAAADALGEALEEGLVRPAAHRYDAPGHDATGAAAARGIPVYAFLHDRVQQAAYALIPDGMRQLVHLRVGRLLLDRWDPGTTEEKLFDIVHHLSLGSALISDDAERLTLARLNLTAGRKAKSSTAYHAALGYLKAGLSLLSADRWDSEYDFMLALHLEAAECEYLCGNFDEAERVFDLLLDRARTRLDKTKVYTLRILQYEYMSRYTDAIRVGRDGLALFGLAYPDALAEKQAALDAALSAIDALVGDRGIDRLVDLPTMQDPEIRTVMKLLSNLHTSCYLSGDTTLTLLNTTTMVRLSLAYGNIEESAYAYALFAAMLLGPIRGDHKSAYAFGMLALRLNDRLPDPALRARVLMTFAWQISVWRMPIEASFPHTREAFRLANETGLFVDAAYALFNESWFYLLSGRHLRTFYTTYASNVDYIRRVKMHRFADGQQVILQWGLALQGLTEHPLSLTDTGFDEAAYQRTYTRQSLFEMFYLVAKLALLYTFEDYRAACDLARRAETVIKDFTGTIWDELEVFYHSLALTARHSAAAPEEREAAETTLDALSARLARWAENAPYLFQLQDLIVSAEIARVRGRDEDAARLYEAAIEAAAGAECPRERALANELYARFWRDRGQARAAAVFMAEARDGYAEWGAVAKVRDLERRYADLLGRPRGERLLAESDSGVASSAGPSIDGIGAGRLDFGSIMKAARAIAIEIELEALLRRLMRIALENAGAERGFLLLEHGGSLVIEAEGAVDRSEVGVLRSVPLEGSVSLSRAVVQYVRTTGQSVVIADAVADERFAGDPYIASARPLSILCVPIVYQGRVGGILYLENNLTTDAFTADRIEVMHVLLAEAAISLENARLYDEMKQEVARRRGAEEDLRRALAEVESLKNRLQAENVYLQEEIRREHNFDEVVGSSPALLAALRKVERVAPTDSTVLISGETGTGKELIARAIHGRSARKDRPLVKVNCSAFSASLVESELFGHVKGAFTGAIERRVGRFELANGGTIFLDEIGDLPLETQVKLLRVLQEREFEPVGSNRTVRVDVRVIAATNRDLEEAVRAGRFRSDLFYRLNVFPLEVPPLRERRPDIPQLVMFFLSRLTKRFGKPIRSVSPGTMDRLSSYPWPGNVRELQNVIERSVVLSQGPVLELDRDLLPASPPGAPGGAVDARPETSRPPLRGGVAQRRTAPQPPSGLASLEEMERGHILAALDQTRWVIEGPNGAARILGLHPNTLRSRMQKLGIGRPTHEIS